MDKARVETWVWVLIYGGLLLVCVSLFVLRAGGEGVGWVMLGLGAAASAAGAALVVVRARMEEPVQDKKGRRR